MADKTKLDLSVEYYVQKINSNIMISKNEEKEIRFYTFRIIFTAALGIVLYGLMKLSVQVVLPIVGVVYVILEIMNYRLMKKIMGRKAIKVRQVKSNPVSVKTLAFRASVYVIIGIGLVVTTLIQSNFKIETNHAVILIIAGLAVYNGIQLATQIFRPRV
jgi:uncharacterized membrane protein